MKLSISFVGALTLIFIVLKLIGEINWSWVWVLSPIWIEVVFIIFAIVFVAGLKVLVRK